MIVVNSRTKLFGNLYLSYLLLVPVKPKPKSKSNSKSVRKTKTKTKTKTKREKPLDSKSRPTDKPQKSRTVTDIVSKGGTPFLKRKKRVRSSSSLESTSLQLQ